MNPYVEDFKSFTEHFIRVWIHTSKISYAYQIKLRVWKNTCTCKIPWMILHNNTRIKVTRMKNYTYGKLHVWKSTRMKSYTYWILSSDWCIVIHVWILSRNFWYVLRFIHVTFYTCNLWRILSTSANHIYARWRRQLVWIQLHGRINRNRNGCGQTGESVY